jgi:hypothetical protein
MLFILFIFISSVEVDGIELRSGKKMKTMREILHEHDKKLQQSDIIGSMDRSSYTTSKLESMSRSRRDLFNESDNALSKSNRKNLKSKTNEKQYSQSEQKRLRKSDVGHYDQSGSVVDYSNIRSRRSLNTDFATHTNLMQANNSNTHVKNRSSKGMYSNSGYDNVDDGKAGRGYSVRTVRRTTEEFDDNGVTEKGAVEASEKSKLVANNHRKYNIRLNGKLDNNLHFPFTKF